MFFRRVDNLVSVFPYFFVGTFIEAGFLHPVKTDVPRFPYFFVGTFIEARQPFARNHKLAMISLLFRRDFH